ncbi:MAG: hypothetical protein AB7N91_33150 [Candidatus Tectimicrobiota bacterium]
MSVVQPQDKRLAEAVAVLIAAIHREVPTAAMRPLPPYDDEDFTLEVQIPAGLEWETVMDVCLRQALAVEDQFGFFILTRVKPAAPGAPAP